MPTPPEDDPFLILGLDPEFEIESGDLNRAYLTRVATLHPDAAGTDADAARINDARRILEDLESRANALLRHLGGLSKEDHRELPPGFLMEILEAREHMESIINSDDAEALTAFAALAEDRRKPSSSSAILSVLGCLVDCMKVAAGGWTSLSSS